MCQDMFAFVVLYFLSLDGIFLIAFRFFEFIVDF